MICSSRAGWTDTRGSFWGQKPLNVLQRLCFLKLKPILRGLWSPQVTGALATVWASRGPPESEQESHPVCLAAWAADRHPAGALRATCPLQPHHPNGWNRDSSQILQPILSSTRSRKLPPAAGGHSWTQRAHFLWEINSKLFSELCLGTLTNIFL